MSLPAVGSVAPDFTLRSTSGADVTLSSFRGGKNVLIAFFPLAFTSTCTTECTAFSDDLAQFESRDTVVLPISVDAAASLKAYKTHLGMRLDLLSDFKREASRAYGVLIEEKFHSSRAYFIVDRAGVVRWAWQEAALRDRRENSELLAQLEALA